MGKARMDKAFQHKHQQTRAKQSHNMTMQITDGEAVAEAKAISYRKVCAVAA